MAPSIARLTPLLVSVAIHAAVAALLWTAISARRERPGFLAVTLVPGRAEPAAVDEADVAPPGARTAAAARRPAPVTRLSARAPVTRFAPGAPAGAPGPAPHVPSLRFPGSATSPFWSTRSLAGFVDACRRGGAPRDSVLDPRRTPEETALARLTTTLNEATDRLQRSWTVERFREAYAENFPAMR
jgi:hypothetical protein